MGEWPQKAFKEDADMIDRVPSNTKLKSIPRKMSQGWLRANRTSMTQWWYRTQSAFEPSDQKELGDSQSTAKSHRLRTCPQSDPGGRAELRQGPWPLPPALIKFPRLLLTIDCQQDPGEYWLRDSLWMWLSILMSQVSPANNPFLSHTLPHPFPNSK